MALIAEDEDEEDDDDDDDDDETGGSIGCPGGGGLDAGKAAVSPVDGELELDWDAEGRALESWDCADAILLKEMAEYALPADTLDERAGAIGRPTSRGGHEPGKTPGAGGKSDGANGCCNDDTENCSGRAGAIGPSGEPGQAMDGGRERTDVMESTGSRANPRGMISREPDHHTPGPIIVELE